MSTLRFFIPHPVKVKKIRMAVGLRCELCGRAGAPDTLEIHTFIDEDPAWQHTPPYLEGFLLVLRSWCHPDLHAFDVPDGDQETLITQRQETIRQKSREILAYMQKSYTPPGVDLEDAYSDACTPRVGFGI